MLKPCRLGFGPSKWHQTAHAEEAQSCEVAA